MSILERTLSFEGADRTVAAVRDEFTGLCVWPIHDIVARHPRAPGRTSRARAASLLGHGWPQMIGKTAAWLDLGDALTAAGLSPAERFDVVLASLEDLAPGYWPTPAAQIHYAAALSPSEAAARLEALLAAEELPKKHRATALALLMVLPDAPIPDALDAVYLPQLPPAAGRALLERVPGARREALLRLAMSGARNETTADVVLRALVFLIDLVEEASLREELDQVAELTRESPALRALQDGGPTSDADGVSSVIAADLAYWREREAEIHDIAAAGPLFERATEERTRVEGAAELADAEAWAAAPPKRQRAIAEAVIAALGDDFALADGPVPTLEHRPTGQRFSLVPGGSVLRGLSQREEERVRELAEAAGLATDDLQPLLDGLATMRPVAEVSLGPFLMGQGPGAEVEPSAVAAWLAEGPFRLPTEAEWEHAARGGLAEQLHYLGDDLPLEEHLEGMSAERTNAFGLWGFGDLPELCADVWAPTHEGAPTDGSPRRGAGPRVCRGGAGQLFPWQGCGEWPLLLSAARSSADGWKYAVGVRPVIGLDC